MRDDIQKVGILGIGAIGSLMATIFYRDSNLSLYYYSRSDNKNIKLRNEHEIFEIPIVSKTNISSPQKLDWLIICLKEYHYPSASALLGKLIDENTRVVVIRNGMRLKEPILSFTTTDSILECIIDCSVQPHRNGFYQQLKRPMLIFPNHTLAYHFNSLLKNKKIDTEITKDFKTKSWKKVCESATLGAILCLNNKTCEIFKDEEVVQLYSDLLAESICVARADGAKIDESFKSEMITKVKKYPDNKGSSMLTDQRNDKPIELAAKNGLICKIGLEYEIETPLNNWVCLFLSS